MYGGRDSGKSQTFGYLVVILMLIDYRFIVVARMFEDDVESSIWKNIQDRIQDLDLFDYFDIKKEKITCIATGAYIVPFGIANNPGKIKSIEACDLLLIEEGEEVKEYAWKKIAPTLRDARGEKVAIATIYNPEWEDSDTHQRLIIGQENLLGGRFIRHINYLDNPFCPETARREAEQYKLEDYEGYKHIYLGIALKTSIRQVFSGVWEKLEFDSGDIITESRDPNYKGPIKYYSGVAFGISQKPTSAIHAFEYDGSLYIEKSSSGIEELDGMADIIRDVDRKLLYCQPEQPATRKHLNKRLSKDGIKLISAEKGQDDVLDSIKYLRGSYKKIYIHPRCTDVIDDFSSYLWEIDKNTNEVLDVPVDKNNQAFHALRHALHTQIGIGD
ncbi:phage terminase large subunit [Vibrio parahaemolyticus]|nr:phage terminase large subunit [Vibrio parahaemolyticus]